MADLSPKDQIIIAETTMEIVQLMIGKKLTRRQGFMVVEALAMSLQIELDIVMKGTTPDVYFGSKGSS